MARRERRLKDGIDAVAIVTPNHAHAAAARAFLKAGIHVICDKPLTTTRREAEQLAKLARESGLIFAVTHNYTGYPMVRQARAMVKAGDLGAIRVVQVEYAQDWLATRVEETGSKQAEWRTDPARSGPAGSVGDIGTHAFNLAEFIVGDEVAGPLGGAPHLRGGAPPRRQRAYDAALHVPARRACSGAARWHPASRTACASASTARRRVSNGVRRTRTT